MTPTYLARNGLDDAARLEVAACDQECAMKLTARGMRALS